MPTIDPKKLEQWRRVVEAHREVPWKGPGPEPRSLVGIAVEGLEALLAERDELIATVNATAERMDRVAAANLEAVSLLREVEWSKPAGVDGCLRSFPVCNGWERWADDRGRGHAGHAPDCRLAAFLGRK